MPEARAAVDRHRWTFGPMNLGLQRLVPLQVRHRLAKVCVVLERLLDQGIKLRLLVQPPPIRWESDIGGHASARLERACRRCLHR